jgi:sterol desaturase/sphingolipid hydroxylase (fatty acid hydroxylase superfamily)
MEILPGWSDSALRLAMTLIVFAILAGIEVLAPWREARLGRQRWWANLGILLVDVAVVRVIMPASLVVLAAWLEPRQIGLLPALGLGGWPAGLLAFVLLDLLIYWQHRLFHRIPLLWRLHRMHHSDTELDVSSGFRFHPLEILLSLAVKAAAIGVLGVPPLAVLVFEAMLNASSQFNHANIRLPERVERVLRWLVVTPQMHVIHHSVRRRETDSNFSFNLPVWDRIFGSYTDRPEGGYDALTIGLESFRDPSEQRLDRLVTQPFRTPH